MLIKRDISLKPYNTFGVDILAKYFAEINSIKELITLLGDNKFIDEKKIILGGGSNILFTERFTGLVIKLNNNSINIIDENEDSVFIKVDAGVVWDEFVKYAVNNKFYGIENLSLIPGTVGAAPIQNIGAYGTEVKETINKVNILLPESLEERTFNNSECEFKYRDSIFKNRFKNNSIITSVEFKLSKKRKINLSYEPLNKLLDDKKEVDLDELRRVVISIRESKLPDTKVLGNGGSFFKNPLILNEKYLRLKEEYPDLNGYAENNSIMKISAGWLIEKCGLKGKRSGNVGVHEKQALVIVNYGGATGKEILKFSDSIIKEVKEKFDITLEREINIY